MATIQIQSEKFPDGFPDGTRLRVEWVSGQKNRRRRGKTVVIYKDRGLAWKGLVSGPVTMNFDEGKYLYKAHKHDTSGLESFRENGEFMVGMSERQWLKIGHMEPKNQWPTLTTNGVSFRCKWPGCTKLTTGKLASLIHENKVHYGVDITNSDETAVDPDVINREPVPEKRGPGRPRKE